MKYKSIDSVHEEPVSAEPAPSQDGKLEGKGLLTASLVDTSGPGPGSGGGGSTSAKAAAETGPEQSARRNQNLPSRSRGAAPWLAPGVPVAPALVPEAGTQVPGYPNWCRGAQEGLLPCFGVQLDGGEGAEGCGWCRGRQARPWTPVRCFH